MKKKSWQFLRTRSIPSVRNRSDRALLERAAKSYAAYELSGKLNVKLLMVVSKALRSGSKIVRSWAASWLWELAGDHRQAAEHLKRLVQSFPSASRLSLVQSIAFGADFGTPPQPELEGEVLRLGLLDRSADVRKFSAERIDMRDRRDLLPLLDEAASRETNAKAAKSMESSRDYLRDGYRRSPKYDDAETYSIWVKYLGKQFGGTVGLRVPCEVADAVGFAEVARRVRIRKENPGKYSGASWDPIPSD